jgi:hypothetical protein
MYLSTLDFAHNVTWHSLIAMTPLSLPLRRVDLTTAGRRQALEIVAKTKEVQVLARGTVLKTQAAMEIQANKKRKEVDFTVGNSVYVTSG